MRRPGERHLHFSVPLSQDDALARLAARLEKRGSISAFGFAAAATPSVIGSIDGTRFRLRSATLVPRFHDVQATGEIREVDGLHSLLTVELRRSRVSTWSIRFIGSFGVLLVIGALIAATQQPIFLTFAVFAAAVVLVLLWSSRERAEDREVLRRFVVETFPEAGDP